MRVRGGRITRTGYAASLLAMLLFALAVVKADLMQLAMALPAAATAHHAMPGMAAGAGQPHHEHAQTTDRSCLYCDTAAHPPLIAAPLPVPVPSLLAWAPTPSRRLFSPRGPPPFDLQARGPPAFPIA